MTTATLFPNDKIAQDLAQATTWYLNTASQTISSCQGALHQAGSTPGHSSQEDLIIRAVDQLQQVTHQVARAQRELQRLQHVTGRLTDHCPAGCDNESTTPATP